MVSGPDCVRMLCAMASSARGACGRSILAVPAGLVWVEGLLSNTMCPSDSLLTGKPSLDKVDKEKSAAAHGVRGLLWTKGIIWSISDRFIHTQADTHPAAAMCEACFTSLSHPRVKVAARSSSIFAVKT